MLNLFELKLFFYTTIFFVNVIMLVNVQNYGHKDPIITLVKIVTYCSKNYAGTLGASLLKSV